MNGARRHKRRGERQQNRTGYRGVLSRGPVSTSAGLGLSLTEEDVRGLCIVGPVCPTTSTEGAVDRYMIRQVLGEEMKANAERLHIEIGSPIPTEEQRIAEEAAGARHRFFRGGCGIHATGTRQVRRLHDLICLSMWSAAGFCTHSLASFPSAG
ncbi:hypothetical protein M9H77_02437 [Catharanthus roseus]|uniref:Uncharacterized protein n=1 Tax=Catharanthus roseus TaxID=4058 RepID=A0ACC0C8I3_CATRO|nr:hypothetical protein M9H77_02437 [Catharanthus roseus]